MKRNILKYIFVFLLVFCMFVTNVNAETSDSNFGVNISTGDTVGELMEQIKKNEEEKNQKEDKFSDRPVTQFFNKIFDFFKNDLVDRDLTEYYDSEVTVMKDGNTGQFLYVFSWEDSYGQKRYSNISKRDGEWDVSTMTIFDEKNIKDYKEGGIIHTVDVTGPQDSDYQDFTDDPNQYKNPNYIGLEPGEGITVVTRPQGSGSSSGNTDSMTVITPSKTSCTDLFEGVSDILQEIFDAFKIVVPILVIGLSSVDFAKAIFGGNDDENKKAQGKFAKRLILAFIFFLLPTLLEFIMAIMNAAYNGSWNCTVIK